MGFVDENRRSGEPMQFAQPGGCSARQSAVQALKFAFLPSQPLALFSGTSAQLLQQLRHRRKFSTGLDCFRFRFLPILKCLELTLAEIPQSGKVRNRESLPLTV